MRPTPPCPAPGGPPAVAGAAGSRRRRSRAGQAHAIHRTRLGAIVGALALFAAGLALSAGAVGADPQLSVTPDGVLIDGQTVTVRGSGLPPGQAAGAIQCVPPAPLELAEALERCDLTVIRNGTVNQQGQVQFRMPANRFIGVQGRPVDCAPAGTCAIVVNTLPDVAAIDEPYSAAVAAPLAFDPALGELPLELDVSIDEWDARSVTATITCSTAVTVSFRARLAQHRPKRLAYVQDVQKVECVDQVTVRTLLSPIHNLRRPLARLLPGPAALTVTVSGRVDRWGDKASVRQEVVLDDTTLRGQRRSSNASGATIRLGGMRVTRTGRAVITAELQCPRRARVQVDAAVLAAAPGGASRTARTALQRPRVLCSGTTRIELDVDTSALATGHLPPQYRRADIIGAGPVEVHLLARSAAADTHSQVMRAVSINRPIRPQAIKAPHRPGSRLRIGAVRSSDVRGSLDCDQSGWLTVFATAAQETPGLPVVLQASGSTGVLCVAGRTTVFDIEWRQPIRSDHHTRIGLYATSSVLPSPAGPFDHQQGGWRWSS